MDILQIQILNFHLQITSTTLLMGLNNIFHKKYRNQNILESWVRQFSHLLVQALAFQLVVYMNLLPTTKELMNTLLMVKLNSLVLSLLLETLFYLDLAQTIQKHLRPLMKKEILLCWLLFKMVKKHASRHIVLIFQLLI